jgi:hypothetical protein
MSRRVDIEDVIKPDDFDRGWDYLEQKFGYSKKWRRERHNYVYFRPKKYNYNATPTWDFLFFLGFHINPLLNAVLCRGEQHPTIVGILQWMFKDRLKTKT